ncbi:MAG: cytochrome c [Winogradskyella sp.]|uniref:c-type cytochrome n=1 Tax=Winogradskyella sp. TaxID=1883156 RepID=UPI00181FD35F|nr:cytochrome c [Winogradskyella sp.]MBT8245498.1 cytochrome c [Winogradskyella sp.]NNK23883.1 cytochrome c [Winogradskyella sp.]
MRLKLIIAFLILSTTLLSCNDKKTEVYYGKTNKVTSLEQSPLEKSIKIGKTIYTDMCVVCHQANGKGVPKAFPPLANSDYLQDNQKASIIGLKKGMKGEIIVNGKTYNSYMAPLGLGNDEIAHVMNYINHTWGNNFADMLTEEEVTKVIKK